MQHFYQNVLRALLGLALFIATGVLLSGGGAMAPVSADLKILTLPMLILTVGFGLRNFVQPLFRQLLRPLRQVYPAADIKGANVLKAALFALISLVGQHQAIAQCPGNVLNNPGYETGDFTGWTITPGFGPGNDDVLLNTTPPGPFTNVQGLYYGVIISDNMNNPNTLYQDVTATPGTVANLSVYAAVHNPANDSQIKLQFLNVANTVLLEFVAQVDEDVDISSAFKLYTLSGTAPAGTTKVRALASTSANTYSNGGPSFKTDGWCLTLTTAPFCTSGLLSNPSFEAGPFDVTGQQFDPLPGWTGQATAATNVQFNPDYIIPDGAAIAYGPNIVNGEVYQQVAATVGNTYSLSFYAGMHEPALDDGIVKMQYYDAGNSPIGSPVTFDVTYDIEVNFPVNSLGGPYMLALPAAPANAAFVRVTFVMTARDLGVSFDAVKVDAFCLTAASSCVNPTGITFTQSPATCTGINAPANNGTITLLTANNGTHYGVSTLNAATYNGPTTVAGAAAITLPQVIKSSIPNTGGTYIVRIFSGTDACYTDVTVTAPTVGCACPTPPCGGTTAVKN